MGMSLCHRTSPTPELTGLRLSGSMSAPWLLHRICSSMPHNRLCNYAVIVECSLLVTHQEGQDTCSIFSKTNSQRDRDRKCFI